MTTTTDLAALHETITDYEKLRERCYRAAKADDGKLMGDSAWLRFALNETDLELSVTGDGIECTGTTYTTQTMSNEYFAFVIPVTALSRTHV